MHRITLILGNYILEHVAPRERPLVGESGGAPDLVAASSGGDCCKGNEVSLMSLGRLSLDVVSVARGRDRNEVDAAAGGGTCA